MVLIRDNPTDLQEMVTNVKQESEKIGLTINMEKTIIMGQNTENQIPQIKLEGTNIKLRQETTVGR